MATEQEELRLSVTLVDNASAGLEKLQAQIKELGGGGGTGGNKHIQKMDEQTKALTETISKMTGSFGEAFKSLGMLRLGFIGGVAGLAAFGYEMAKQLKDLGEYTDKIRNLGQLGKDIGVAPSSIKNIAEQLKVYGVTLEQTTAATSKFAQRMAELQRDPRVRMGILQQTAQTPQAQADMKARLDALNHAATLEDKMNIILQMRENIKKNARDRGETEERAADEANRITGELFSYDAVLSRAGKLKNLSDEEAKAWAAKQAAADHYSETLGKIEGHWDNIIEKMKENATSKDSWLTKLMEQFERLSGHLDKGVAGASSYPGGAQQFYKDLKKQAEDSKPHDFEGRWPGPNEQFGPVRPGGARLQNQSYRGIGIDGSLLHQAAFTGEEHKKGVEANTDQLKRLNDLLAQAMGLSGNAAGGGGFQNAGFTTGGGGFGGGGLGGSTPRGFGGGGYADLGTTYGSRGGGAPNGSHVGAGAGAGAGETPAGPPGGGGDPSLTGNAFLQSQRARLKKEMDDDPELKRRFAAIIEQENPRAGKQVAESAMNRAAMTGRSMASILQGGPRSFYGPARLGKIEPTMRSMSAKTLAERYKQIDAGLAGGNVVRGATDQGSRGDPNFERGGQAVPDVHGERFGYWGGYKGVEASRRWAEQQQAQVAAARRDLDAEQNGGMKVEGSGKIRVDVNAPKGTSVSAESSGLFKTIETYRQTQMEPAERGPSVWGDR